MKKLLLSTIFFVACLIKVLAISGTTGKCTYDINLEKGVMTISGSGNMGDYGTTSSPYQSYCAYIRTVIIEEGVTSIGKYAFSQFTALASVTIPSTVTSIGDAAFKGCRTIEHIEIPEAVKSIGSTAFEQCYSLESVKIPNGVTMIEPATFMNCKSLNSVSLPKTLVTIGSSSFADCSSLQSIIIPEGVTDINYAAFVRCSSLKVISIPSTVKTIGEIVFGHCTSLEDVYCYTTSYPTCKGNPFKESYTQYAILHVPNESKTLFRPWEFGSIVALTDKDYEELICATPTIEYFNGRIVFKCDTEDVTYVSNISSDDISSFYSSELELKFTYRICVYATKIRYTDSDKVYATISWNNGQLIMEGISNTEPIKLQGDVNEDGVVDINDVVNVINIMAGKSE